MRSGAIVFLAAVTMLTGVTSAEPQNVLLTSGLQGQFLGGKRTETRLSLSWTRVDLKMNADIQMPGNFPFREQAELYQQITQRIEGLWAEFTQKLFCADNLMIRLDAGYLFPANRDSLDTTDYRNTVFFKTLLGSNILARQWKTSNEWWSVDGSLNYFVTRDWAAVLGVRYEFFDTRFYDPPFIFVGVTPVSTPGDIMDITRNIILPYFGLEFRLSSSAHYLALRAITMPQLSAYNGLFNSSTTAGLTRSETRGGFAGGTFGEVSMTWQINGDSGFQMCLLTKLNLLYGKSDTKNKTIVPVPGDVPFSAPTRGTLFRSVFSIGGEIAIPFTLPL